MENIAVIVSPFIALISGVVLWYFNEKGKRAFQIYVEKLRLYEDLIMSLDSFYQGSDAVEKRQDFNNKMRLAWMYCSKEVIEKGDDFLETTRTGSKASYEERNDALDALMRAIRSDMKLKLPLVKFKTWISN